MTRPPAAVLLLFLITRAAILAAATTATDSVIYHLYGEAARARSVAGLFRAHDVEYPQLSVAFMAAVATLADALPDGVERLVVLRFPPPPDAGSARFQVALAFVLLLLDCALLTLLSRVTANREPTERLWSLGFYVAGTAALGPILYDRLDLIVGAAGLCAVVAAANGRSLLSYGILTAGAAFKLVPVLLLPLVVIVAALRSPRLAPALMRETLTAGLVLAVWPVASFLFGGGDRAFVYLDYHAARGLEIGSAYAAPVLLTFGGEVRQQHACYTVRGPVADAVASVSPFLTVAALTAAFVVASRALQRAAPDAALTALASGSMFVWLAFIVTNKVGSPQYLLWLMPLLPLVPLRTHRERQWACALVAVAAVTTMTYPYLWWAVHGPQPPGRRDVWAGPNAFGYVMLLTRWAALLGLTAWLGVRLWGEWTAGTGRGTL